MAAALLGNSPSEIRNVPDLRDIDSFCNVIRETGTHVEHDRSAGTIRIDPSSLTQAIAPYELVRKMRASFYMLGALLGRTGEAVVSLPGGCAWGPRPVDLHLKGLEAMGADVELIKGDVHANFPTFQGRTGRGGQTQNGGVRVDADAPTPAGPSQAFVESSQAGLEPPYTGVEPTQTGLESTETGMGSKETGVGSATRIFKLVPSSVGATVNLLLAAVLQSEHFVIEQAALEPDVVLLCRMLQKMGANIEGVGTSTLSVRKVPSLKGVVMDNDPDRIEAGTFMIAAAMHPESSLTIHRCNPDHLGEFPAHLEKTGANITRNGSVIHVDAPDTVRPVSIRTGIYPGFPTDLQAQWATLMTQAIGESVVEDQIYFDRFSYVPELARLGADIRMEDHGAVIQGPSRLVGASVMSTDLRASVSLVMAAMVASGRSQVLRVYHLDRGYETLESKLNAVGANIRRVSEHA